MSIKPCCFLLSLLAVAILQSCCRITAVILAQKPSSCTHVFAQQLLLWVRWISKREQILLTREPHLANGVPTQACRSSYQNSSVLGLPCACISVALPAVLWWLCLADPVGSRVLCSPWGCARHHPDTWRWHSSAGPPAAQEQASNSQAAARVSLK